jgi:predicted aldo/keto reductase-like oxidoreductase
MFSKLEAKIYHMGFAGIQTEDRKPHWASDCLNCGKCESKCPQGIQIRTELKKVQKSLEGAGFKTAANIARTFMNRGTKRRVGN